jgi:hypothetical protein
VRAGAGGQEKPPAVHTYAHQMLQLSCVGWLCEMKIADRSYSGLQLQICRHTVLCRRVL